MHGSELGPNGGPNPDDEPGGDEPQVQYQTKVTTVDFSFGVAGSYEQETEPLEVEYEWHFSDFFQRHIPRILKVNWGHVGEPTYPPAYTSAMSQIEDLLMEKEEI
jgi:hypothetical protein